MKSKEEQLDEKEKYILKLLEKCKTKSNKYEITFN